MRMINISPMLRKLVCGSVGQVNRALGGTFSGCTRVECRDESSA